MSLRVALIGCGEGAWAHVRGWLSLGGRVQIVGLADPDPKRRRALRDHFEQQHSGVRAVDNIREFDNYPELFADLRPDAVDILLPHSLHKDCILTACQHGAHWLCEKPLCINRAEAEQIHAVMSSAAVTGMCAHNQIFMPALAEAKRLLNDGALGQIYTIISQGGFIVGQPPPGSPPEINGSQEPVRPGSWRADPAQMGGGELIDAGYHPSYRLLYLAGERPVEVIAMTARHRVQHLKAEDTAVVFCRFPSGATGMVRTSWAMEIPAGHHPFHVIGEKGELFGGNRKLYFQPTHMQPAHIQFPEVDTFLLQIRHFVECLESGTQPIQIYTDGLAVVDLIFRAYDFLENHGTNPINHRGDFGGSS